MIFMFSMRPKNVVGVKFVFDEAVDCSREATIWRHKGDIKDSLEPGGHVSRVRRHQIDLIEKCDGEAEEAN